MIKIFKTKFNKLIALLTTTSLLISFVVGPTAASAINNDQTAKEYSQIFKEFILPYSYGKITKSHFAGTDRVIINIQDLHCHPKVQKNIANIIETFDNKYGVNNIYLEGAYGDVSTKWITDQIKKDNSLLEKMMDTGRLTGAEYYSALSGKAEIIKGLEEKEPYLDNITRLGSILDSQEKIDLILKSLDESVNEVKKKYYTKRQYKIEHLFKEYKDGKINSQKYYALLSKHIDKLGIDLTKYENTLIYVTLLNSQKDLNYKQITKELQSLISILKQQLPYNAYRALLENTSNFQEVEKLYSYIIQLDKVYNLDISLKFTELDKYFKYIELSKKINPVELVKEDEFLSQEINTRFSQTPAQKDVVFLVHFGRYLRDYVTTKITLEDYKYYKENIEQYRKIYNKYVDNRVLSLLDEYIAQIDKFYEINMDRNLYFTKNMFEENEQFVQIEQVKQAFDDINKIISNMDEVKRVDVVVTGGFHSQTVTELLEQQNVSYIVITPNVTDGIKLAEETYYELAKEQSKISFQTIAPLIASLSPQLQAILLNKIESEDTEKIEQIMKMDEAERAQTIADLAAAKLLESDDLGNLKETLNEIVKNLVDEYHKEKVTSELVSEIKNLQSLLKNKENLQKVIDLLSEGTVKQSVILVSDMFDDIYEQLFGIFPSFADKDKLEPRDAKSSRKYFEEDIEKYSIYKIQDEDYYGYDIFDSLDIWFSGEELILSREIIEQSNFNEDLERFIGYLGQNNIADYELLNKILTVLKSINEEDRKNGFCGILHAVIDEGTNKIDKEQALKAKEKILSFLETPTQLQFEICDLFSIVDLDYNENTEKTFFDALLDVINKDGYKNIDIDFLFEVVDNSRLIAELETRENLYDFLTLSIEKRRLIYNFYKSSENNFDIGINQLTLNFIISVLNKYNFTDEQFNYIMELICSINLKDNKDGKAYIDNLKDKEINLLVLDQVKYLRIYNRYMMNLIFSDIDRKNIQIIIPNLQKIIELFDGLQKYQIDTLETENKGFALVLFSSVKFKEYCEKNKITDITKQYQLAIRITRRIHSITGDKFFTLSYTKTEKIIERTLKYYDTIKQIVSILTLFTNKTAVFSLHNGERNDDGSGFRFTPAGLKKVLEILDIKPEIFEVIEISFLDKVLDFIKGIEQDEIDAQTLLDFVNSLDGSVIVKNGIIKDLSHKKKISKNEFIEHLNSLKSTEYFVEVNRLLRVIEHFNEYKQDKGVFIFDGHGHDESFSYSENGALTVKQISKALINAYNNGVDLKNITLMFESCHSYDFADNIINELRANGITSFPQIITDAGRETIYGYTNRIDIDGTTIRVSNLFYSLLKFLKLKTEEELKQMKGRLTFKDIADAPRYLSNNTMFVTNQQVIEENSKLEADIIDIINEQDAEDIETVTAKNDIAYAGTYKVYAEMMLPSTQKALNKIGNIGIIKAIYKDKSGENFRFTTLGVALGVLIEIFSFWSPNFIKAHNFDPSIQAGMTAVVWAVRALSIGIGIWTGSILALFLAETITHFIWNMAVILIGRQDLLLQTSKAEEINTSQQKWTMSNISKEAPYTEKYKLVYYIFEKTCRQMDIEFPEEQEFIIINNIIDAYDSSFWEIMDFENWVYEHFITDIIDFQQKQSRLTDALSKCFPDDIEDILWIFSQCLSKSKVPMFILNNIIDVANDLEKTNNIHFSEEVYAVLNILKRYNTSETEQILVNIGLIKVPNALYKKAMDDIQFKQLEESIRENEDRKTIILSEMMLPSTQKALNDMGNTGIIKAIYKEKSGENFRFTTLGVALGVLIETFSFWSPNFIKAHNFDPSIQAGMTAVIWVVRALSIGIGIWTGSILALFVAETITHFIWNIGVIVIGRQDLLLQTSKEKSNISVIVPSVEEKKQARELTQEEEKKLEETLTRTKVRIKNSTLEITEENNKNLAMELQTIFDSLLDSMVDMGKISESDKKEYELILYLSDEVNAFTVSGSKTVFISTGMLNSFSTYLNGKIGKEHVAAILAHELEHTVQDKRVYRDFISGKGDQKKDEYDSDIQAIFILDNAGYNPISVQDLMEYLAYLEEKTRYVSIGLNKILDAHPDAQNRLVKIKTFLSDRNIFLRSTSNSIVSLENGIPYYGETDMRSDIHVELGYYEKGVGPRDSNGFITKILKKYGDKITLYKILDIFNDINRFVDVNEILNYINSVEYPFFNDKIKNLSDNQKKVIFRLMNSFDGHYPSNAEIYKLCPDMNELKEVFDFIIEPGNYFFFFSKISFLNISYLVAALYNSGNLGEKDYDKIQKFLSMNEDSVAGFSTFYAAIDKDTVDFYIDKFELFDNSEKYKLYSEFRDAFSKEKDFSDKQKEKLRKFFLTPSQGGTGAYHMFRGSDFFGLLYPEMTLKDYIESITEEQKQKILEDAEKNEIEKYNSFTRARNREVLGDAYDPAKESPGVTSMYEIYRKSGFAYKKFEKSGNKWEGEKKYQEWLSKNDDALFAEWLENKKAEWFFDEVSEQYRYLMFERFESELLSKLNTLEEKLDFLFPGGLMELGNRFSSLMDYETSIPKILKKDIENIKNTKELFAIIDAVINYFDKENLMKKRDLSKTVYVILSNIDRSIVNNFTIEDIQKLFELSILKGMSDVTNLLTVSLIIKRKNPKSILDFGKIFSMCDYKSKERHKETSDFVQNVMDEEQLAFLLKICYEKNLDLRDILPLHVYDKLLERFDENFSLEEKYRYSIYKDKVYPYNVHQKIKNEEELKDIPIEHLKRFLGIEIPIHKDYFMNHSMGRIGIEDSFALRILQNKVEQYQQNFGKSFYDVKNFNEFAEKVKGIEDVFYPWSNKSADNGNEIFSNEVDMVWANLLHNMCGFGLETKSFVFVNIHGEELLNVWCELEPNYDFVPNTQQTNELLSAFVLIKKYLPKEQSVAYARMLYEMIGKNKTLSVFESVEKNLELLDFFFEGFSEIKDDYIYELLENYDIDINTYNECLSKTTYYAYKDETENTGKNFLYRELATVLSNGGMTVENKIKFIAWLISDKQEKPEFLKNITVKNDYEGDPNHNRTSLGEDAKVDIFRNYFWSMTRSERTEYIRELLTDILRDGTDGKGQDYEILKNTLADAFFDSMRNNDNEKIVDALKMSFKIILDSLASHENKSTSERQILFISDLIDSLVSMSKSNFSLEEKEARQIGKFIVAMGSASGVAVVKILQILSNSKAFDGLGKQGFIINEEISKVRSSNEQLSKRVVFQQLENLGMLESVKSVGKCLGSASIGVTYLINMKDGSKRIIKIKRPSVLKNYEQDLVIAERLIDFFKFFDILPQSNKNMIPTIGFLEQVFNTELNFEDEVDNLLRAKANLSQTAINTPDIVGNYNVDSFMQTMASGKSFDNAKSIYSEQERAEIYSKILLEFFREVFMDGFFHADLHEGNIFVDKNKDITFIDWGACGYVEESKRDDLETVFVSLLLSDSDNFMEALKKYDIGLYEKTSPKSKEIVEILNSNDSLESKFGRIFTIFNQIDMSRNHDFLMFIQGLSKIAKYIDNLSAKEKIVLLLDDTVIYDLLQNKQVLANIYGLLEKTFPDKYGKIIKFVLTKLVKSNEESLRDVITNLKLFILNFDDDAVLRRLISSILKALSLPSVFENQLKVLISKKIKQLSDMSDLYSQRNRGAVKEEKGSRFKVLAFIKERFFKEAVIQQDKIEFSKESEPVVFLIQKDGVQYSLTLELNYVYRDDNDKNYIDVGIKDEKLIAYLSTIGKEAFSKETSKYTSIDSIEELLGIKINVSGNTVSVTSENAQTDIKYIRYEDIPKIISDLKGQPIESFQEKEAELLKNDSGCNGVENLFLDQDIQAIKTKIDSAIKDNKSKVLFALYPFSNDYDIASLSDKQKLALYLQISKSFEDIARTLLSEEYFYRIDNEEINALKYSTLELIQKAFFAGNASLSKPIYLSCDYYGGTPTFTVYRKLGDETIDEKQRNLAAVVNKRSEWAKTAQYYQEKKLLTTTPQERTIRRIGEEKYYASKIEKAFRRYYESESLFSFDDDFGLSVELEDFEDLFEEGEESSYIEDKETSSAIEDEKTKREVDFLSVQEILDAFGNNGIIKRIYKNNAGENFKFTTTGVIFGAVIELIPFFMPNFINGHHFDSSVKSGMTAVVWVIRALTIGIGCVTWSVPIAVISNIILHSVWNRVVILLGKQHLMLMLNKNSVETYLKDKGLDTKKIDNLEEQIDFLLNILRGELDVYVNYRSFQYFSLKKETRKHIFDLLQDSNVDRFFFGRFIYAMEMAEENGFTDNEIVELIKFLKNHQDLASFVGDEADKNFFYKTVVTLKEKKINITEDVYLQIMFLSPLKNTNSIANFFNLKEENRQAIYDIFKDNDYFKYFANNIIWLVEKLETDNFSKEMIGKVLQITANVTDTTVLRNRQKIELLIKMADWLIHENYDIGDSKYIQFIVSCLSDFDNTSVDIETLLHKDSEELNGLFDKLFGQFEIEFEKEEEVITIMVKKDGKQYSINFYVKDGDVTLFSIDNDIVYYLERYKRYGPRELFSFIGIGIHPSKNKLTVVTSDKATDVKFIKHTDDGKVVPSSQNQVVIESENEQALVNGTHSKGIERIFLDKLPENSDGISDAIGKNKLFAIYPVSQSYDIDSLTDEDLVVLFRTINQNIFKLAQKFPKIDFYTRATKENRFDFVIREFVKNAFVHGNLSDPSKPIYIKFDGDKITVYNAVTDDADTTVGKENRERRLNLSTIAELSGVHKGISNIRDLEKDGLITVEQESELLIGTKKYFVISAEKTKSKKTSSTLLLPSTQETSDNTGETEITINYDEKDYVTTLLINKGGTIYSVRVVLDRITKEDEVNQNYIKTGVPNRKMFLFLSSIGENAFSKLTSEFKSVEDIEKLTGVKIEISENTISAKATTPETYVSCVKGRDVSPIVSSLIPLKMPIINAQEQSDIENLANAEVTEIIYLDESKEKILERFRHAIENNSLIVIYPFSNTYDLGYLTDEQLYALYFNIQGKLLDLQELLEDTNCLPDINDKRNMSYILKEFIKNAFVHGNLSDTSKPIYIKFVENGFTVYNKAEGKEKVAGKDKKIMSRLYLSASATLTGSHRAFQIIQDYEKEGLISITPEQERNIKIGKNEYYVITAVKTSDFGSLMERVLDVALIDTNEPKTEQEKTIEYKNNINRDDRETAQKEAEKNLAKIFTPEQLEIIDLLASVIFDSIKYVNSTRNTSSVEFVNIAYALQNGLFNSNILPKEGEDLKQHILDMLRHYIEVSKQKKGEDNLLVRIVNSNKNLLNDMADYLADIIVKNNLVEKNKIENEKRKINIQKFIDGVKGDDKLFSAVMICSANENRSAIWHIMFKDFLEKHGKRNTKVFSAGVFYDISQRFMNEEKTDKTKPLVDDYIETLSLDERYKNINENLRDGFRSRYIEYLKLPTSSQPVFIVAGEQHRAQLIKLGYDSSWIFLMSDFYSDEFKKEFKQKNKVLGQQLEDNNVFSMSEFPDPFENQILRQDLPELVRSVVEYNFEGEPTPQQLPEDFRNLTDDYNQFEHMEGLPDFSDGKNPRESMELEEGRQKAIQSFNEQIADISSQDYQILFRGNTKYLYLLQNRKNKYILLNIASQPNIDLKFRLFALLYLDKLRHELTSEETTRVAQTEKAVAKRLKKQIENNEFEVLNNLDLRAYMMGVYLILRDYADKISVPDIINRAIIINPFGKTMARDDGLFAKVDLFIVIHELAHRIFYKPQNRNEYVSDPLDELVSYIVPNMFLRKIINLSLDVYSESQNLYTIHHADGVIDYIKMGKKFHSLYSMFDKNAEEYKFKQEEHSAPIAFLDYLFAVHQKAGKPIDWDVLLDVIRDLSLNKLDQLKMFRRILDLYMKRSIEKGSLTKEETEVMKKEIEEMQVWTILVREVIEIIESTSPNTFNLLKGNKDASVYKTEILSKTKEMKESFKEILNAFTWNVEFSKSELLVLLIMNIMKNVEYEQLENNFGGVINGIIDVINKASGELKLDLNKDKYSQQEYRQILNFVLMNYTTSKHVETSVTNDIYTYISKNLDYLSFATKLINMVFGTRDLTKIFSNKKLLIATSKEQEENFRKLLSDREDVAVVTMEVKKDRVYDIREGSFLDVQRGIKATYDSKENKIIVYSKEGINITEDEIKNLITEQYFSERKDDSFDDVIAFADEKVKSLQDITDRLNIAYTESVSIPNKETTFDLSSRIFMKNIVNVCEQESKATGIKTFIITFDQAKEFTNEIQALQERDFKFIVSCKIDAISNIKYYDGLIIDDSKTDYEDISQLLPVMEKVRKHVLKAGVAKPVSVKFSNPTYGQFNSAGINIFDTYGMLPIVEDSYITNSMKGKFVVEKIRDNNIERFLRQNNVVGFVIDNARTFADKKSKLRDLFSKEHKYSKGYNAALSSKFDYTCTNVELLTKYLAIEIDNDKDLKETDKQILDELTTILLDDKHSSELKSSLSFDSKAYLKYLGSKGRYEEMTGFIRGIAMNSARAQIVKGLEEKGFNLNMNKFANVADGKYQKAFLTIAVQLMMEDIDITELLETGFIDSDMTAKEYLDSVLEKVNINIEEILKKNEYKIEKLEKKDIPKTIEDFKNYVVLLDNLKIIKDTTAGLDMSIKAVRSMLSAA